MANQAFDVTPGEAQQNETGGDDVTFTVTGIEATTVDIALVECENVTTDDNGVVSFADDENTDADAELEGNDQADFGSTNADITTVNGNNQPANTTFVNDAAVVNGAVQFAVDSDELDCVQAVIFDDANDNDQLDLDANNQPTEAFAVTGAITFTAPLAATGAMNEDVFSNDEANNEFVGCEITGGADTDPSETVDNTDCFRFLYDANDEFFIDANDDEVADATEQATLEEFEAALTADDDVTGTYNANPSLVSTFILEDEAPVAPASLTAAQTQNAENTSVTLTFPDSTTEGVDSYNVYRDLDADAGDCPAFRTGAGAVDTTTYTLVQTVEDTKTTGNYTVVDSGLQASTQYCYAVTAVDQGDESDDEAGPTAVTTAATATTDADDPIALDTEVTTNSGFPTRLDTGDTVKICYNEQITAPNGDEALVINDADGDVSTLNSSNATFALGSASTSDVTGNGGADCEANRTLVVTVTGVLADENTAGDGVPGELPATIIEASGIADTAGNLWVPDSEDVDRVIDVEGAEDTDPQGAPTAVDADTNMADGDTFGDANTDNFSVEYDENILAAANATVTVDWDGTGGNPAITYDCSAADITCTGSGTQTLTVTSSTILAAAQQGVFNDGVSQVTQTGNVTDADGNEDNGFPEVIDTVD